MKLLKQLYSIWSGSRQEKPMREFICAWIKKYVKDAEVSVDKVGNVLVTRGKSDTYPCIVSHMDQVQQKYPDTYQVMSNGSIVFAMNFKTREYCGLGADDKNGIWICLNALKAYKVMKCAFFVNEESGMTGSSGIDMAFFDNCRWVIQCDRKGYQDFINYTNGVEVCTEKFVKDCNLKSHRYEKNHGTATDVGNLKKRGLKVCAVNLSCGYYEAHSSREYTVVPDLLKCQKLVHFMVERLTDVYPHENKIDIYKPRDYSTYHRSFGPGAFLGYQSDEGAAEEFIRTRMENTYRATYENLDDDRIDGIAKDFYNRIAGYYNLTLNFVKKTVHGVIDDWKNEDYAEQTQMLTDSIYDMYEQYKSDVLDADYDDEHFDDVIAEPRELTEEEDKQFIIDTACECVESYPLLCGVDVLGIFNAQFGTSYVYDDMKSELDEAIAQTKADIAERERKEAEAKRKAAEEKKKKESMELYNKYFHTHEVYDF